MIIATFSQEALPLHFLWRPLGVAVVLALGIALAIVAVGGRGRTNIAVLSSLLVALPEWWPAMIVILSVSLMLSILARWRGGASPVKEGSGVAIMVAMIAISAPQVVSTAVHELRTSDEAGITLSKPVYLILLDGYPRADTLNDIGIDNSDFLRSLERRQFDVYPNATSSHGWTHRTLRAFLQGSDAGISESATPSLEEKRAARDDLVAPSSFAIIDPPVGHVVLRGGSHQSAGGINDFEMHLVGASVLGRLFPELVSGPMADSLKFQFERSLQLAVTTNAQQVFAHLMMPHPPFIYAGGMHACWPDCNAFDNVAENIGISPDRWAALMESQLTEVNRRVVKAMDQLISTHPDAVIVLFSDHGGRISYDDRSEWHRSFLASRSPGHKNVFAGAPGPTSLLRVLTETYQPGSSD